MGETVENVELCGQQQRDPASACGARERTPTKTIAKCIWRLS
ncbi:MAG: hypothetical protein ACFB16_24030 [Phormidesmis sp.]